MTMNMMESFLFKKVVVSDAEAKSTALEEIVDSLEGDYEDVLSRAEESLEESDNESFISNKLIQDEIKLNKKYKKMLLDFYSKPVMNKTIENAKKILKIFKVYHRYHVEGI